MNYYNQIKEELINNEIYKKVKDYSKNKSDLNTYYNVGKLNKKIGKGYSSTNLKYMNYIDKNIKTINQDNTIGIIIVRKNNHFVLEYCSDSKIFETVYQLS